MNINTKKMRKNGIMSLSVLMINLMKNEVESNMRSQSNIFIHIMQARSAQRTQRFSFVRKSYPITIHRIRVKFIMNEKRSIKFIISKKYSLSESLFYFARIAYYISVLSW